jgi:hypothetical protein
VTRTQQYRVIILCDKCLLPLAISSVSVLMYHTHLTSNTLGEGVLGSSKQQFPAKITILCLLSRVTCHSASFRKAPKRRILPLRPAAYVQSVENFLGCVPSTCTFKPTTCALPSETQIQSGSVQCICCLRFLKLISPNCFFSVLWYAFFKVLSLFASRIFRCQIFVALGYCLLCLVRWEGLRRPIHDQVKLTGFESMCQ